MYNGREPGLRDGELLTHRNGLIGNDDLGSKYKNLSLGLVAYYKLDSSLNEATGLTTGINGSGFSGSYVTGVTGNAASFPSNSRIDIADNNLFSFTNGKTDLPFSISIWAYFISFSAVANFLINKRTASAGGEEWQVGYIPGTGLAFLKLDKTTAGTYQGITSSSTISLNTWYNIVVTDNGSMTNAGMKMYVNNVLQTGSNFNSGTYTGMPNGASVVAIGQTAWAGAANTAHVGYIEDVGIWRDRILTKVDTGYLFNDLRGRTFPF